MNSINSTSNITHNLKIKNSIPIEVGLDIGGSLTKMAVSIKKKFPDLVSSLKQNIEFLDEIQMEENIILIKLIQTVNFSSEGRDLLKKINQIHPLGNINATGGGAYKYSSIINEELNLKFEKQDELLSLVKGYILMSDYFSLYMLNKDTSNNNLTKRKSISTVELKYPHIAVNIGSGVSILLVNSVDEVKRVGGTMMGGGTLIGLSKLLMNVDNYNDIMKLAEDGDNLNLDLLVKDIYTTSKSNLPLESDVIASSFSKITHYIQTNQKDKIKKEDIAKSLLVMICYHIAQLAVLVAEPLDVKKRNSYAIELLDYATKYWNKDLAISFNMYDGFLAAIGSIVV